MTEDQIWINLEPYSNNEAVKNVATVLRSIATDSPHHTTTDMWYLSAEQHAIELIVMNLVYGVGLLLTYGERRNWKTIDDEEQKLTRLSKIYRFILTICFIVTIIHKILGQKLGFMLMPCHVATTCYLYCLWTPNKQKAESLFNISMHYMFYTILAMLFPDYKGLALPGEIVNFWVHHVILLIVPVHLIFTQHYKLDRSNAYYYRMAACLGGLLHYNIYLPGSLITGLNIGYMICPPPKGPLNGQFFHFKGQVAMLLLGALFGFVLSPIIESIGNRLIRPVVSTKKKQ